MTLPKVLIGAAGAVAGAAILTSMSAWMVAKPQLATLQYLNAAKLQTLDGQKKNFTVCIKALLSTSWNLVTLVQDDTSRLVVEFLLITCN